MKLILTKHNQRHTLRATWKTSLLIRLPTTKIKLLNLRHREDNNIDGSQQSKTRSTPPHRDHTLCTHVRKTALALGKYVEFMIIVPDYIHRKDGSHHSSSAQNVKHVQEAD